MNQKSKTIAYLLWFFFGLIGIHKFYLGKVGMGVIYFFTFGIFFIGWFIDLFTLGSQVDIYNALHNSRTGSNNTNMNNIVVNVSNSTKEELKNATHSVADQLTKLNELKNSGVLTEEEYAAQKAKVLNS